MFEAPLGNNFSLFHYYINKILRNETKLAMNLQNP